jgi:hypothetical protein
MRELKAVLLLKSNIDTLLQARGQTRKELAFWCRRSESWLSQIFTDDERNMPLKYLDRIADFFGIATYQLMQPGISPLAERRSASERRSGKDRRLSRAIPVSQKPGDVDLMDVIRALSREGRQKAITVLADILNDELRGLRARGPDDGPPRRTPRTPQSKPSGRKRPRKAHESPNADEG